MIELLSKFLIRHKFQAVLIVILFYTVGVAGIGIPGTQSFFVELIPFALLLSFAVIILFHHSSDRKKELIFFSSVFLLAYLVEILGVNTHFPFGNYSYGHGLGVKTFGTPLLIGINWVMLVYCSASVMDRTGWPKAILPFGASLLMVLYDIILEHVAPLLDMWSWAENTIPLQNYLAWFVIAFFFHRLLQSMKIKTVNPIATAIFVCQLLFFIAILIFLK